MLIAAPRRQGGWGIDDAHAPSGRWSDGDAPLLWRALQEAHPSEAVRFVCPVYEQERNAFAQSQGLTLTNTWWLSEIADPRGDTPHGDDEPTVEGADVAFASAPPVYQPGGPMLALTKVQSPDAVGQGLLLARRTGCAGLVVDVPPENDLERALREAGLRPHCNYYNGTL